MSDLADDYDGLAIGSEECHLFITDFEKNSV